MPSMLCYVRDIVFIAYGFFFRSDQFTIAGTEYQDGVGGAAQESEMGKAKGLTLKAGLHVQRKHKDKCKHKHKVVYTCDKQKQKVIAIELASS